jgi:hypothetical protein
MMETDTRLAGELVVTCARDDLAAALGIVTRAVSTRGAVQVLSGVELSATGDSLRLASAPVRTHPGSTSTPRRTSRACPTPTSPSRRSTRRRS